MGRYTTYSGDGGDDDCTCRSVNLDGWIDEWMVGAQLYFIAYTQSLQDCDIYGSQDPFQFTPATGLPVRSAKPMHTEHCSPRPTEYQYDDYCDDDDDDDDDNNDNDDGDVDDDDDDEDDDDVDDVDVDDDEDDVDDVDDVDDDSDYEDVADDDVDDVYDNGDEEEDEDDDVDESDDDVDDSDDDEEDDGDSDDNVDDDMDVDCHTCGELPSACSPSTYTKDMIMMVIRRRRLI